MRLAVEEAMRAAFRPEFLNRVDDIVIFHSLSLEQLADIVEIQLAKVRARRAERKIELMVEPAAMESISAAVTTPCPPRPWILISNI